MDVAVALARNSSGVSTTSTSVKRCKLGGHMSADQLKYNVLIFTYRFNDHMSHLYSYIHTTPMLNKLNH